MNSKKNIIFSAVCVAVLILIAGAGYYFNEKQKAYDQLYLDFKETEESYEIQKMDPIKFIAGTNAKDVTFPKINPKEVGEHTYVYVVYDSWGNNKEYVLKLNFEDPYKPYIILTQNEVYITEGETLDYKSFVSQAMDPVDGNLKVKIKKPKKLEIGENHVSYTVQDKHKNKAYAVLKVYVNPKPEEKETQPEENKTERNNSADERTEVKKEKRQSTAETQASSGSPSSSTSTAMPASKIFRIDQYGSIAAADGAATSYGQSNCPAGHTWSSSPYSENGAIVGYLVTFN